MRLAGILAMNKRTALIGGLSLVGTVVVLSVASQLYVATQETAGEEPPAGPLAPEALRRDIAHLGDLMERVHPAPIAAFPLADIDGALQALRASIDRARSPRWLYRRLAPVVAAVGDDHVRLHPPPRLQASCREAGRAFPLDVRFIEDTLYVTRVRTDTDAIRRGAALRAVNGIDAATLRDSLIQYHAGTRRAQRRYHLAKHFGETLCAVYGPAEPYEVVVQNPDAATETRHVLSGAPAPEEAPAFTWEPLDRQTLLLTYNAFRDPEGRFAAVLKDLFEAAREPSVQRLIIDLRDNEGGAARYGDQLLRYLTAEPFRQLARSEVTISREARAEFISHVPGYLRWVPLQYLHPTLRPLWLNERGATGTISFDRVQPGDNSLRFTGRVTVLVGPGTMSSASLFAATIEHYGIGTLVGDTAGGYATHYGNVAELQLPHSRLPVDMPTSVNYGTSTGPIVPTHRVRLRPGDLARGVDPVLQVARAQETP
jgi:hypothetical protein